MVAPQRSFGDVKSSPRGLQDLSTPKKRSTGQMLYKINSGLLGSAQDQTSPPDLPSGGSPLSRSIAASDEKAMPLNTPKKKKVKSTHLDLSGSRGRSRHTAEQI